MRRHTADAEVLGPRSLTTSRAFWEGFSPSALDAQRAGDGIRTVFRVEADWFRAEAEVTQRDPGGAKSRVASHSRAKAS